MAMSNRDGGAKFKKKRLKRKHEIGDIGGTLASKSQIKYVMSNKTYSAILLLKP